MASALWGSEPIGVVAFAGVGAGEHAAETDRGAAGDGHRRLEGVGKGKVVSPPSQRAAVRHVRDRQGCSERRACKLVGAARSTARYAAKGGKEDAGVRQEVCA